MKFRIYRVSDQPMSMDGVYTEKEKFTYANTNETVEIDANYIEINTIDELVKLVKATDEILISEKNGNMVLTIVDGRLE